MNILKITSGIAAAVVVAGACALGLAVWLGGPKPIAPLASINAPFAHVDYSGLPGVQHYPARDGTALAYRHYAPATGGTGTGTATRRIVLVHGSSASSRSMHPMAQALAAAGFTVDALDMRGHGDSGTHGQAAYVGQLEDDLQDFMRAVPFAGPSTLLGFSSGGGFVLRFAGGARQELFDRYVLLSPFLRYNAPTLRPSNSGWASVGMPRMISLRVLNRLGVTAWNSLPVINFALDAAARPFLTGSYSYSLATNFGPHDDYAADIRSAHAPMQLLAGTDDELMVADRYAATFAAAGKPVPVTLVPGAGHISLTLAPAALRSVVTACQS